VKLRTNLVSYYCSFNSYFYIQNNYYLARQAFKDEKKDPKIARFDNMLIAEGVAGPKRSNTIISPGSPNNNQMNLNDSHTLEHSDYKQKLSQIWSVYHAELEKYIKVCNEFTTHVVHLLKDQAKTKTLYFDV
jgi:hypothetical protein